MRVTSPGSKQCEGDIDTPGDGLPLDSVNPAYDLVNLRPSGCVDQPDAQQEKPSVKERSAGRAPSCNGAALRVRDPTR